MCSPGLPVVEEPPPVPREVGHEGSPDQVEGEAPLFWYIGNTPLNTLLTSGAL